MAEKELALPCCPLRHALEIVGGKWKLPILCLLSTGQPTRYSALKRNLQGITGVMLSQSLKELESFGIISRKQYNVIPPRVEYTLTEEGKRLLPPLNALAEWGREHLHAGEGDVGQCGQCGREAAAQ